MWEWNGNSYKYHIDKLYDSAMGQVSYLSLINVFGRGLRSNIAINIYKSTIRSKLLYPAEIMTPSDNTINKLEIVQNEALRRIFGVCYSTSVAFLRVLSGCPPITALWEVYRLKYYHKVMMSTLRNELPGKVFHEERKLAGSKPSNFKTVAGEVYKLLKKYNLEKFWNENQMPKNFKVWLKLIEKVIYDKYYKNDLKILKNSSTTKIFYKLIQNINNNNINISKSYKKMDEMIDIVSKYKNRKGAQWMYRFWSGATPELWDRKRKHGERICNFCNEKNNNIIDHILIKCEKTKKLRKKYNIWVKEVENILININDNNNIWNLMMFLNELYSDIKWEYSND